MSESMRYDALRFFVGEDGETCFDGDDFYELFYAGLSPQEIDAESELRADKTGRRYGRVLRPPTRHGRDRRKRPRPRGHRRHTPTRARAPDDPSRPRRSGLVVPSQRGWSA